MYGIFSTQAVPNTTLGSILGKCLRPFRPKRLDCSVDGSSLGYRPVWLLEGTILPLVSFIPTSTPGMLTTSSGMLTLAQFKAASVQAKDLNRNRSFLQIAIDYSGIRFGREESQQLQDAVDTELTSIP